MYKHQILRAEARCFEALSSQAVAEQNHQRAKDLLSLAEQAKIKARNAKIEHNKRITGLMWRHM
jgi:hypothetical protein